MHQAIERIVAGSRRVAMQYSASNDIPYVALVDAGTVELVRSFGPEVVSSADLVQLFDASVDEAGWRSHCETGDRVQRIKDEAFELLGRSLREAGGVTEFEVMQFILGRFEEEGLTSDGHKPIVGFNDHPADPHFEPTPEGSHRLGPGDTILIDLWARRKQRPSVYYDVTWCGFAGAEPPAEYARIFGVVCAARDAALGFVREALAAGRSCYGWQVDDACRSVVEAAGYGPAFLHRTGHSIGEDVHGNGVNIDNLETRDTRRLIVGSCFSIEPGIYLADRMGVRTEIDVWISPRGTAEIHGAIQHELLLVG
jgi:Xaa-Pro aminopeptidase